MDPARLRSFGFWIEESAVLAGGTQFWIVDLSPRNVITVSRYPRFIRRGELTLASIQNPKSSATESTAPSR